MNSIKNILFINFGGIGDEILFLPTIKSVENQFPISRITLCCEPRSKSIKDLSFLIDEIIEVDIKQKNKYFEMLKFIWKIRQKRFDIVVCSGTNPKIPLMLFLMGIKQRYAYDSSKWAKFLLTKAVKLNKNQYAGLMYHDLVNDLTPFRNVVPQIEMKKIEQIENSILIHPGVSKLSVQKNIIKTISTEKWAELINSLLEQDRKVFLTGGPDDKEVIEKILLKINSENPNFYNLFGTTKNLLELANQIKQSKFFICSDSAPMHIAIALGVKTYAIFGPTDEKKLIPENSSCEVISANCSCRPCLWDKRQTSCKKLECLNIDFTDFLNRLKKQKSCYD